MNLHRFLLLLIPAVYIVIPWWGDLLGSFSLHWSAPFAIWGLIVALSFYIEKIRG